MFRSILCVLLFAFMGCGSPDQGENATVQPFQFPRHDAAKERSQLERAPHDDAIPSGLQYCLDRGPYPDLGQGIRVPADKPEIARDVQQSLTSDAYPWVCTLDIACREQEKLQPNYGDEGMHIRGSPETEAQWPQACTPQRAPEPGIYETAVELTGVSGLHIAQVGLLPIRVHPEQMFDVTIRQEGTAKTWNFRGQSVQEIALGYVLDVERAENIVLLFRLKVIGALLHHQLLFGTGWNGDGYTTTLGGPGDWGRYCSILTRIDRFNLPSDIVYSSFSGCAGIGPFLDMRP